MLTKDTSPAMPPMATPAIIPPPIDLCVGTGVGDFDEGAAGDAVVDETDVDVKFVVKDIVDAERISLRSWFTRKEKSRTGTRSINLRLGCIPIAGLTS
jgi:hypothetical protein